MVDYGLVQPLSNPCFFQEQSARSSTWCPVVPIRAAKQLYTPPRSLPQMPLADKSHQHLGRCHRDQLPRSFLHDHSSTYQKECKSLNFLFMSQSFFPRKNKHATIQDLSTAKAFSDVLYLQINVVISSLK